jgi:hypothetical protein
MGVAMEAEQRVSKRLAELVELGQQLLSTKRNPPQHVAADSSVDSQLALQWVTSVQNLLANAFGAQSEHYKNFVAQVAKSVSYTPIKKAFGVLMAAQDDFNNGQLFDVRRLIEADVFDDFLEQAEHLLSNGYYQSAAVVSGCVLEDSLRTLCQRNSIPLADHPKLDKMNADLAKASVYNKLVQKRITALADLRNKAAHGEWDQFSRDDVEDMVKSVRRFAEEHLA